MTTSNPTGRTVRDCAEHAVEPPTGRAARPSYSCPVYTLKLVREKSVRYRPTIEHQFGAAAAVLQILAGDADREHFVVLFLNSGKELVGASVTFIGALSGINTVTPREVFKAAILANAQAIVLGHCHPSGDVNPSPEDEATTHRLVDASKIVGIPILDHIIVGGDATPFSFYAAGLMP